MTKVYPYGYLGFEEETLAKSSNKVSAPDLKESFCIGPPGRRSSVPPTVWPRKPRGFKQAWLSYYKAMEGLSATLLQSFAVALGLDDDWFDDKTDRHIRSMRALNYPVLRKEPKKNQLRAGAHTDYGSLTILKSDSAGLQVKTRDEVWVDVPHITDSFIVNLGDLMAYWTNDRWIGPGRKHPSQAPTEYKRSNLEAVRLFRVGDQAARGPVLPIGSTAGSLAAGPDRDQVGGLSGVLRGQCGCPHRHGLSGQALFEAGAGHWDRHRGRDFGQADAG